MNLQGKLERLLLRLEGGGNWHSFALNSGKNILDVSKMAGTSVTHVEKTYRKYDQKRMRKATLTRLFRAYMSADALDKPYDLPDYQIVKFECLRFI